MSDAAFRQLVDRILRCREAEDEAKADTKGVYAEAKSLGYDKTAVGKLVAELRAEAKNPERVAEQDAILETYRSAYHEGSHVHARARTREERRRERFDENMDDARAQSDEAAALGLISPEAAAETQRLTEAMSVKFGTGKPLRPHCQNRERCAGVGRNHCWSCSKIAAAAEAAA